MTTTKSKPEIAPEISDLIDKLVAEIVAQFVETRNGPAMLRGEREARKVVHEQSPKGRRAVAKKELWRRLMTDVSNITAKMLEEDIAARHLTR
ncbi:hypothetical protein [Hyphomicrobium sp.]|jgi:hypothetical protein|uniref:hypothetical protein n=1 Tax=Hyphomicrobium sp. TaxID=82 RepID=UPI0035643E47